MNDVILFGAGKYGAKLLELIGEDKVACYCDNNSELNRFCGKAVISYNELKRSIVSTQ